MSITKRLVSVCLALASIMPLTAFAAEEVEPLDYSLEENWADIQKYGSKPVDVFFITPTLIDGTVNEDGFASISEMQSMMGLIRLGPVAIYEDSCNVYMPFYRQASMTLAYTCNKDNAAYLDVLYNGKAYADIVAALDYYFEHYNNGKPFILAGHSQGSAVLINVLTHYMQEHKEYLPRMIAAYSLGFAPSEEIFNEDTGLKFATCADDTNVVVSFTTEGPGATGKSILLPENPMVINPLTWTTDDSYGSVDMNKGCLTFTPDYSSASVQSGCDDAQINMDRKTVVCTTRSTDECTVCEEAFATESFHEKEQSMYYVNVKENVQVRIDAYFADQQ